MRKYAVVQFSREHAYRRPIHRINPETKRTFCQVENTPILMRAGNLRALKKFDVLPQGNPMCKNCEKLAASAAAKGGDA